MTRNLGYRQETKTRVVGFIFFIILIGAVILLMIFNSSRKKIDKINTLAKIKQLEDELAKKNEELANKKHEADIIIKKINKSEIEIEAKNKTILQISLQQNAIHSDEIPPPILKKENSELVLHEGKNRILFSLSGKIVGILQKLVITFVYEKTETEIIQIPEVSTINAVSKLLSRNLHICLSENIRLNILKTSQVINLGWIKEVRESNLTKTIKEKQFEIFIPIQLTFSKLETQTQKNEGE